MAIFTVTKDQVRRNFSFALGKLLGQQPVGSGDPDFEFSILTEADRDADGEFLDTYTVTVPTLRGVERATNAAIQAVIDNPNPEQPPVVVTRQDVLRAKLGDDTITDAELREYLRLQAGFE